ncbi:stalk domain-containing protein [Paenibacillus tengchongensis]|uniref:stalk domain-containing protein n=1 Tax=Paenibacillus tengchongensis TaxID=2608684 RepID=UPI00124D4082|nr:stalk domain-containing protein [Paenibacillus tengchongensis]
MSKFISGVLLFIAIFFSLPGQAFMEPSLEVSFQDEQLEQAIRQILHKSDNEAVTQQDMKSLTVADLSGRGIKNLQGLEYALNITELDVSRNEIEDIGPLKPLTNMDHLDIGSNRISDLRGLEGMTRLISLEAGANQIKDLAPLKTLTNLSFLDLKYNLIYDLGPLKFLKYLSYLDLTDNRVWNLDPIRSLKFDKYYDTGALIYTLQLNYNYLDLRSTSKNYQLLDELNGEGYHSTQRKVERLVIGSTTAYVWNSAIKLSEAPFISSSRTYVPIRFVSKWLGAEVSWNQSSKEVTIRKGSTTIRLKVNEKKANVNGETVSIDAPLLLKNNSTFVPVRFVSDLLESSVEYMANPKTVLIFEKK